MSPTIPRMAGTAAGPAACGLAFLGVRLTPNVYLFKTPPTL